MSDLDPFAKLFEYSLTVDDNNAKKLPAPLQASPPAMRPPSTTMQPPVVSRQTMADVVLAQQPAPQVGVAGDKGKKIRRLPREIIKAGEYGPEYEEWRRKQEEQERAEAEAAAARARAAANGGDDFVSVDIAENSNNNNNNNNVGQKKGKKNGGGEVSEVKSSQIRMEVVERGVPKREWFLVRWRCRDVDCSEDGGDQVVVYEEDFRYGVSHPIWSLPLHHKKPRGTSHCPIPGTSSSSSSSQPQKKKNMVVGRFFSAYLRRDGSVLCRSASVLVAPKVELKSELRQQKIFCTYQMDTSNGAEPSSWDWIGLFHASQEENYSDYVTWSYIDTRSNTIELEAPISPGQYVCCYFCSCKKFCPVAFSNFLVVADINCLTVTSASGVAIVRGSELSVAHDVRSHLRETQDWIGLYRERDVKKNQYLGYVMCGDREAQQVKLVVPMNLQLEDQQEQDGGGGGEKKRNMFVVRYISMAAAPLTGGAIITSSKPFQIEK